MHRFRTRTRSVARRTTAIAVALLALMTATATPVLAATSGNPIPATVETTGEGSGVSLESAAAKASKTGRKVAMSLIALGFSIASIMLAFRRDFKEAAGVFVVGLLAILLATPAGINVLHDTVNSLFGAS